MRCTHSDCTVISINVVGLKYKTTRQDRSVMSDFLRINSSKLVMPRPFNEDLPWRSIRMKEMLEYQVDELAAALRKSLSVKLWSDNVNWIAVYISGKAHMQCVRAQSKANTNIYTWDEGEMTRDVSELILLMSKMPDWRQNWRRLSTHHNVKNRQETKYNRRFQD